MTFRIMDGPSLTINPPSERVTNSQLSLAQLSLSDPPTLQVRITLSQDLGRSADRLYSSYPGSIGMCSDRQHSHDSTFTIPVHYARICCFGLLKVTLSNSAAMSNGWPFTRHSNFSSVGRARDLFEPGRSDNAFFYLLRSCG